MTELGLGKDFVREAERTSFQALERQHKHELCEYSQSISRLPLVARNLGMGLIVLRKAITGHQSSSAEGNSKRRR